MRRPVWGRKAFCVVGGLMLVAAVGPTALMASSSASASALSDSGAPCTSATYALTVTGLSQATQGWSFSVSGQVDFANDAADAEITLPTSIPISALAGANVQLVFVGGTAYVSVPAGLSGFVGGASWVSIALPSSLNSTVDSLFSRLAAWCGNGQSIVNTLNRHRGTTSLGSSSIGGVEVNGMQVHSSSSKVTRALGLPRGFGKKKLVRLGGGRVPVDVWDNAQGQLTELSVSLPSLSITLQLTNIDQPVSITAPAGAVALSPQILSLLGNFVGSARAAR